MDLNDSLFAQMRMEDISKHLSSSKIQKDSLIEIRINRIIRVKSESSKPSSVPTSLSHFIFYAWFSFVSIKHILLIKILEVVRKMIEVFLSFMHGLKHSSAWFNAVGCLGEDLSQRLWLTDHILEDFSALSLSRDTFHPKMQVTPPYHACWMKPNTCFLLILDSKNSDRRFAFSQNMMSLVAFLLLITIYTVKEFCILT